MKFVVDQILMDGFYQAIKEHLIEKTTPILPNTKKLATLKSTLLKKTILPRGIIPRGEEIACCAQNGIKTFLEDATRNPIRNCTRFVTFVEQKFDSTVLDLTSTNDVISQLSGLNTGTSSIETMSERTPMDISEGSLTDIMSKPSQQESAHCLAFASREESGIEHRTVPVSLNSILHKDISDMMKEEVHKKLKDCLTETSEFISDYGLVLQTLMLSLRDLVFAQQDNEIVMQRSQGFRISHLFPTSFQPKAAIEFTAAATPEYIAISEALNQDFKLLFEANHLTFVYSAFFGSRGNTKKTITSHPLHHAMNENMKSSLTGVLQVNDTTPNVVRINALTRYMTNMANMWSGRSLFNKLLGKLLDVLLRIHLTPTREQKYQEWVANKKTDREESKNMSKSTSDKTDFLVPSKKPEKRHHSF
jgi:hypothetical protein